MNSASWPSTCFAAWNASWSQLLPGNTTMPNVTSVHLDAIAFDHRIGQKLVGDFGGQRLRLRGFRRREIELEILALPDVFNPVVAERMQRVGDGLALRVEHRLLERDE